MSQKETHYVIISSDDNPMYKDFYPIISKRWFDLGFKVYYVNITNEDNIIENEYGIIHKIKKIDGIKTGFQSQVVRLYASNFIDSYILTSDIDMLPINGEYFNQYDMELNYENIIVFSGQPYGNVPYYPMCYVKSHSKNLRNILEINDISFEKYCNLLLNKYGESWNTDENFMYDKFQNHLKKVIIKSDRDFSRRIDRGHWSYDVNLLKNGWYIDSHLLRPFSIYKKQINTLLEQINKI